MGESERVNTSLLPINHNNDFFKMQEIPSDVLLLTTDYLDSPTMINCRQVSKKWLDMVDGNRSLYSFFYLPKDSKPFSRGMFDMFAEKSVSGLKAISIIQDVAEPERVLMTLLNSNSRSSLRYFLLDTPDSFYPSPTGLLSSMENLYNFSCYSTVKNRFSRFRDVERSLTAITLPSDSKVTCSLTTFHLLDGVYRDYSGQKLGWCSASLKHLAIMIYEKGPFETLQFPNLQVLELHRCDEPCSFSFESCPILKAIFFRISFPGAMSIKGLPASLERIWLSWSVSPSSPTLESADLQELDSSFPHLEDLRLEDSFWNDPKILDVIRARRSAVEGGAEVGGIKMKPIKKLTVSREKFSNEDWLALGALVEELVDLKDAPKAEEISI